MLFGVAIAVVSQKSPAIKITVFNWALLSALAFEALLFTPVATYLFRFYPHWSMLYLFDPQIFPQLESYYSAISVLIVLLNFIGLLFGYIFARISFLKKQYFRILLIMLFVIGGMAAVGSVFFDRIILIGDFDEYWRGEAVPFYTIMPGYMTCGLYVLTLSFVLWVKRRFWERDPVVL